MLDHDKWLCVETRVLKVEFESWHCILRGHFSHKFVVNIVMFA